MSATTGALRELHQLHLRLREVHEKLTEGPRQVEIRRKLVQRRQENLEEKTEELRRLKLAADEKSLQLKTNESKIAELKLKLNTASSNREYDIIKSQIDADTMANSVLEDEILEALEKVDRTAEAIATCEAELSAAREEEQALSQKVTAAEPGLREEANRLEGALAAAERELPAAILDRYRRLVGAHGADALAAVEEKTCTACYTLLSPNECVELNVGKTLFCRSCGRLLYRAE